MRQRLAPRSESRRRFLKVGGLTLLGGTIGLSLVDPARALGAALARPSSRELVLRNVHTGESGRLAYWSQGRYLADGLQRVDHLLRDHRTDETRAIDPALLDLLHDLAGALDLTPEFEIVSGYRSPATNAMLRRQGHRVAKHSYHMEGKAVDVRLAGADLRRLHAAALKLKRGGVGLYSGPGFVHVDTGPVRTW